MAFVLLFCFVALGAVTWQYSGLCRECEQDNFRSAVKNAGDGERDNQDKINQKNNQTEKVQNEGFSEKEELSSENIIPRFMQARIERNQELALSFLSNQAREQFEKELSNLQLVNNNFVGFEILNKERIKETQFRFLVEVKGTSEIQDVVEAVTVTELPDTCFISYVELAG